MRTVADVEAYLQRSGHAFEAYEDGHTFVLRDRNTGQPIAIRVEDELILIRTKVMELAGVSPREALFGELLRLNAEDTVETSYGVSDDAVLLTASLRLSHLDYEELASALEDVSLALSEHVPRLRDIVASTRKDS